MTLVERLRKAAGVSGSDYRPNYDTLAWEAADRIERLEDEGRRMVAYIKELDARIEALEAVLRKIADKTKDGPPDPHLRIDATDTDNPIISIKATASKEVDWGPDVGKEIRPHRGSGSSTTGD